MKKVCVVGNFSGRNAGDAAILGGLLEDISKLYNDLLFEIPTINTKFVERNYASYHVKPVSLLPWNLSLKIFGVPIFRSALNSDLILVTDAILFDRYLFNPLFNYLSTMALLLPIAKKKGIPVVLYNVSLGPVYTKLGKTCLERVVNSSELIIVRDRESIAILDRLGIRRDDIEIGADCALNVTPTGSEKLRTIIDSEHLDFRNGQTITFNVNSYINVFVSKRKNRMSKEELTAIIAKAVDSVIEELKVRVLFVVTQPMDLKITQMVMERVCQRGKIPMVSNVTYSYQDLAGLFFKAALHMGMRTHSLILASSGYTPIVGIVATPKNRGFIRSIEQEERMIEFPDLTAQRLSNIVIETYKNRQQISDSMRPIVDREKRKARAAAQKLAQYLS